MLFALLHPHTMTDMCFCIFHWWKVWMVPLVFGTENSTSIFPKKEVEMWTHLSTAHISTVFFFFDYLRWALVLRIRCYHCIKCIAFSLSKRRFKLHFLMQQQTVLSDSSFLKYSWAHVAIFNTAALWFFIQCHLRFSALPYTDWDSSGFPESFHSMVVGERLKFFVILYWEMWFLICLAQSDEPWLRLRWSFYTQTWYPGLCYQSTCLLWTVSKYFNLDIR